MYNDFDDVSFDPDPDRAAANDSVVLFDLNQKTGPLTHEEIITGLDEVTKWLKEMRDSATEEDNQVSTVIEFLLDRGEQELKFLEKTIKHIKENPPKP